jgi:FkbM family methyltransferase
VFSLFKIKTLKSDAKERDFFHFLNLLQDGKGDVLDVGANIGIMTVHLAQKLPNTLIHAFEPIPANIFVLTKIVSKFKLEKIKLHPVAVGDDEGKVQMILPNQGKTKMQGLCHVKHDSIQEWNEGEEFDVAMNQLDNLLNGQPIQAIKIDVENFEYYALKGAMRILKSNKPIIYAELWDNENRTNCFKLLSDLGYFTYIVENNKLVQFESEKHTKQNFIFIAN